MHSYISDTIVNGRMVLFKTSPQASELNQSCSEQIHFNGPGLGPKNKSTKNDCTLTIPQLSLTKAVWGKLNPTDLVLIQETKEQSLKINKFKEFFYKLCKNLIIE